MFPRTRRNRIMTHEEALKLKKGDVVYWHDPVKYDYPENDCSHIMIIDKVEDRGDFLSVFYSDQDEQTPDGGFIECLAKELEKDFRRQCLFTVRFYGTGKSVDECWNDAVEGFSLDPGAAEEPDAIEYEGEQ